MRFPYAVYDVFTDVPLAGNPLAVVFDAGPLDTEQMQAVAREFNLSETVFILPAADPRHSARIRIFKPLRELPIAGHPTVGAAIAIAERARFSGAVIQVLEEEVGPVRTVVTLDGEKAAFAEFDLPRLPERLGFSATPEAVAAALGLGHDEVGFDLPRLPEPVALDPDPAGVAAALGLDPQEIGFENHRIAAWSAGVPYVMVPVSGLAAVARIGLDARAWLGLLPAGGAMRVAPFVYCRESLSHDSAFHARMFAPWDGIAEDPATGSAVAAFAGQIRRFDQPVDGPSHFWIEQGVEMGRPSRIRLEIDVRAGAIEAARIGGSAVMTAEGHLTI
jgi:trans-2,3-dihydro-3-hydroxyanthranilate isomerase